MLTHFWLPLLDHEVPIVKRMDPECEPVQRDDGVWAVLIATSQTEAEAADLIRLVIAEEMAGSAIHETPKPN